MLSLVSGGSAPSWAQKLGRSCISFVTATPLYYSLPLFVTAFILLASTAFVLYCSSTTVQSIVHKFTTDRATMAVSAASKANDPSGDFKGDIKVNNNPPTKSDLEKVALLPVLDVNKKSHTFKSLWADDANGPRRVLVVFIRHFFCGVRSQPSFLLQHLYPDHALTFIRITELPRIPTNPLLIPDSILPLDALPTHLRHCHRLRLPRSHPHVHQGNQLSLPHLCRPHSPTIPHPRHDQDAKPRSKSPRIHATKHAERSPPKHRPRTQKRSKNALGGRFQTSGWRTRV